jgi:hypothetical protein
MPAINIQLLKAAAIVSGKEETRYYLKGVCVEVIPRSFRVTDICYTATDGHRIAAFCEPTDFDAEEASPFSIIIPSYIIADIKLFKPTTHGALTKTEGGKYLLQYCGRDYLFAPLDATFPDWRRVIPDAANGKTSQFNPQYLADFGKVAKALGGTSGAVFVHHNGDSPAPVSFPGVEGVSYACAIMPFRGDLPAYERPAWAKCWEK